MTRYNNPSITYKIQKTTLLLIVLISGFASCMRTPKAMDLFKPDSAKKYVKLPVPTKRTLTLLLGGNNKILYFLGDPKKPLGGPSLTGYGKDSLGKVLTTCMAGMKDTTDGYLIVLIKSSDKATYKNFVGTIDMINISGVKSYGIVDITDGDKSMLKKYAAY